MRVQYKEYTKEQLEKIHKIQLDMLKDIDAVCKKHGITYFAVSGTALGAVRHQGYIPWDDDIDIAMTRDDYDRFRKVYAELGSKYTFFSPDTEHHYYNFVPIVALNGTRLIVPLSKDVFETGIFIDIFLYEYIPDDSKAAEKYIRQCYFWRNLYVMGHANFELLKEGASLIQKVKYTISDIVRFFTRFFDQDGTKVRRKYLKLIDKYKGKTNTLTVLGDPYAMDVIMKKDEILPVKHLPFEDFSLPVMQDYELNLKRKFGNDYMEIPPIEKRVNHCPYILDFGKEEV